MLLYPVCSLENGPVCCFGDSKTVDLVLSFEDIPTRGVEMMDPVCFIGDVEISDHDCFFGAAKMLD